MNFVPMTDRWCCYINGAPWIPSYPIKKYPSHVSMFLPAPAGSMGLEFAHAKVHAKVPLPSGKLTVRPWQSSGLED